MPTLPLMSWVPLAGNVSSLSLFPRLQHGASKHQARWGQHFVGTTQGRGGGGQGMQTLCPILKASLSFWPHLGKGSPVARLGEGRPGVLASGLLSTGLSWHSHAHCPRSMDY